MSSPLVSPNELRDIPFNDFAVGPERDKIKTPDLPSTASTLQDVSAKNQTSFYASPLTTHRAPQIFIIFPDGSTYMGHVLDHKPHGQGLLTYSRGNQLHRSTYEGTFAFGEPHGIGVIKFTTGYKFEGRLENGHMKEGKLTSREGSYAQGTFRDQQLWEGAYCTGRKTYTYKNGKEQNSQGCCTIL